MDKYALINIFNEIAQLLQLKDESFFKINAYQKAAAIIEETNEEKLIALNSKGKLSELDGVGTALAAKISEFMEKGLIAKHQQLLAEVPQGLLELLNLPGLGQKKVRQLWQELAITNLSMLEKACLEHQLAKTANFGSKSEEKILTAIADYRANQQRFLLYEVESLVEQFLPLLKKAKLFKKIEISGQLRRKLEVIDKLEFVAIANQDIDKKELAKILPTASNILIDKKQLSFLLEEQLTTIIHLTTAESFAYKLLQTTGSEEHLNQLSKEAKNFGFNFFRGRLLWGEKVLPAKNEEKIYKQLKLAAIPPELREGYDEIELAKENNLPKAITIKDIKGILHVHSNYSDGELAIEELASIVQKEGYQYLGICDHSQSAYYAGGLSVEDLKRQWAEIDKLNEKNKNFTILKGIESDILPDGSLDYPEKILEQFDFIIGSVHSAFSNNKEKMSKRIIKAIKNPYLNILGHPSGRLLLSRHPYSVDMPQVIAACAEENCLMEINSHPFRLDLDWRFHRLAKKQGVKFSINPDAHSQDGLNTITYGITVANKGGLQKEEIINSLNGQELSDFFNKQRQKRSISEKY